MVSPKAMNCLENLLSRNPILRGIIQVGAHHGEEHPTWERLGIRHKAYFEPVKENFDVLTSRISGPLMFNLALGNQIKHVVIYTETVNGGQSCSVLPPKEHLEVLPWIKFDGQQLVPMTRLDDVKLDNGTHNFLYIDAQGYELEVLKGAKKTLETIDYIITEVNRAEVFEGCAQWGDIEDFLQPLGFDLVHEDWHGDLFGDALFIRRGT
jgi:FkbM family methyltransferase